MSQAVEALARRGLDPVVVEDDEPGEHVLLAFPFGYGDLTGVFDAISHFVNGVTRIVVAVPFAWIDVDRLKLVDLALPIDDWEIDLGDDEDPGDNEVSPLLLVSAVVESGSLDDAIEVALTGLTQFASALVDQAMLGFGDAEDDDEVADLVANLMSVKASDPAEALRRVRLAAALSRDLGDQLFASQLEVAEAELLLEFGSVLEARRVAETAWARIGEPADQVELLTVVARARARSNDLEDACALMRRGLAAANDDASIARLQGNLGIILIENGERVEGMAMLTAALNNYGLSGDDRAVFTAQRSISRDIDGAARSTIYEGGDVLDALNSRLNRVSSLVLSGDLRAISAVRPEIDALLAEIIPMLDVAGDLHRARVLHAQASLAYIDRQFDESTNRFEAAIKLAHAAGDLQYVAALRGEAGSLRLINQGEPGPEAGSLERIAYLTNSASTYLPGLLGADPCGVARPGLDLARRAMHIVDHERHRYGEIEDRLVWASFAARVYELVLAFAIVLDYHVDVVEVLERVRAQGLPLFARSPDIVPDQWSTAHRPRLAGVLGAELGHVRAALGDLPVGAPVIATARTTGSTSSTEDGLEMIQLDDVVYASIGTQGWWWGCHLFADRLYWAVRAPDGRLWSGAELVIEGADWLRDTIAALTTLDASTSLASHPLGGERNGRLESMTAALSARLVPPVLSAAIAEAAALARPIDVVWSAPKELASLPMCLMPVGHSHLWIEGARVAIAPPSSLVRQTGQHRASENVGRGALTALAVLGPDPDLVGLERLVGRGGLGLPPQAVLGSPTHIAEGVAGTLASPQSVLRLLPNARDALFLYYGHIDQEPGAPLTASLSLTDGRIWAPLDADALLSDEPQGAPSVAVLAGCSSLSLRSSGTGEWWGLGTALLWQGGDHVVGSTLSIVHSAPTIEFVADLVADLRTGMRPHIAVHRHQLAAWRRWTTRAGASAPLTWAGWVVTSASG